ncbi:hypothetical protein, partial [Geomonas subterranea]|uniref:hypothetical protein n=1 Tax=Geomonas subterranea TaxID=2847989 RepID=UPI001CD1B56E
MVLIAAEALLAPRQQKTGAGLPLRPVEKSLYRAPIERLLSTAKTSPSHEKLVFQANPSIVIELVTYAVISLFL